MFESKRGDRGQRECGASCTDPPSTNFSVLVPLLFERLFLHSYMKESKRATDVRGNVVHHALISSLSPQ
jgi:hypothetical protein